MTRVVRDAPNFLKSNSQVTRGPTKGYSAYFYCLVQFSNENKLIDPTESY